MISCNRFHATEYLANNFVLPLVSLLAIRLLSLFFQSSIMLLAFSLHSSAFLRFLFKQSSHLSCGLPRFLQPTICPAHFCNLPYDMSSPFLQPTICPVHFTRSSVFQPTLLSLQVNNICSTAVTNVVVPKRKAYDKIYMNKKRLHCNAP